MAGEDPHDFEQHGFEWKGARGFRIAFEQLARTRADKAKALLADKRFALQENMLALLELRMDMSRNTGKGARQKSRAFMHAADRRLDLLQTEMEALKLQDSLYRRTARKPPR